MIVPALKSNRQLRSEIQALEDLIAALRRNSVPISPYLVYMLADLDEIVNKELPK